MASQPLPDTAPQWQGDLERIGVFRRILQGRRWYKVDWWFVVIASVMVVFFIVLALFPGFFAPYSPTETGVGPRLLAPGEDPAPEVLLVAEGSGIQSLYDLPTDGRPDVGVVQGTPSSEVVREEADTITEEYEEQGSDARLRLSIQRYETIEEVFQALADGDVLVAVASGDEADEVLADFPTISRGDPLRHELAGGFVLGTNKIGQDVLSRLIWGTRVSLLIGFSSALASLFLGVPLGLMAGFVGGRIDRVLTVIMDSLYAFPGLILAIAITAVLGPSILNVIIAIAVLYIPTYYRIVRGQTLSTKEALYVEAARSIGARARVILSRYIFPNVIPSVAIIFSVNVADAILTGAGLSFLGLGLPPNIPDWGIDLAQGRELIQDAWWLITFPGLAVMLIVLAFTMMGEGLMEIFNPKLRER
jgi:peptide/nickel transport system permease protein